MEHTLPEDRRKQGDDEKRGGYVLSRHSNSTKMPVLTFVLAALAMLPMPTSAAHPFLTPQPAFITLDPGVPADSTVTPIISSGEMYHEFLFEGLPDGIGLSPGTGGMAR